MLGRNFNEFEVYFRQLQPLLPKSADRKKKEKKLKADFANLAQEYFEIQRD